MLLWIFTILHQIRIWRIPWCLNSQCASILKTYLFIIEFRKFAKPEREKSSATEWNHLCLGIVLRKISFPSTQLSWDSIVVWFRILRFSIPGFSTISKRNWNCWNVDSVFCTGIPKVHVIIIIIILILKFFLRQSADLYLLCLSNFPLCGRSDRKIIVDNSNVTFVQIG